MQSLFLAMLCSLFTIQLARAANMIEDLPSPYNLQAVVLDRNVSLKWEWEPPTPSPKFQKLGYEITRGTDVLNVVTKTAHTDLAVPIGIHTYRVRAKGTSKQLGKRVTHVSAWSEPAETAIKLTCGGPPAIKLTVTPTKKVYGSIPALRLHFVGAIKAPEGCTLTKPVFHIDSGMSTERSGPLSVDANGRFDEYIDAMGPEEEDITGGATFKIFVTAQTEAGGGTSSVYTIDLERRNPYAPKER